MVLSILVLILFSDVAIGIFSMVCTGAVVSSLEIARRLTTTGICGGTTQVGIDEGETHGAMHAPSESWRAGALAITHLLRTCCRSLSYMNIEGTLGSSLSFVTAFTLNYLGRALSNISTGEYSAKAPLLIILWLMLL